MRWKHRGWTWIAVLAAVVTAVPACSPAASPPGPIVWPAEVAERFVDVRPPLGPTWVVSTTGLGVGDRQLLASLQGLVNRSSARLIVRAQPADDFWIAHYRDTGQVQVLGSTDLTGALDRFTSEASGYVLVSEDEPWTINAGMTVASVENALVTTEQHRSDLERRGLRMIRDLRGRWPDGPTAYESVFNEYADVLSHTGIAVLRPTDLNHDFAYQQRFAVVYGRPTEPGWDRILGLIRRAPRSRAVYGWIADQPIDEPLASPSFPSGARSSSLRTPPRTCRSTSPSAPTAPAPRSPTGTGRPSPPAPPTPST